MIEGGYQFVVLTDADSLFPDLRFPLEKLFSHWNITTDIALAAAIDPDEDWNMDTKGKLNLNSGFVIGQNTKDFNDLMLDWINCPTNVKYENCNAFLNISAFHDQAALSEYVRYTYPDAVRELAYAEANGCEGKFVQHLWCNKGGVAEVIRKQVANLFMSAAREQLMEDWDQHHLDFVKFPVSALPGVSTAFSDLPRPTPTHIPDVDPQSLIPSIPAVQTSQAAESVVSPLVAVDTSQAAEPIVQSTPAMITSQAAESVVSSIPAVVPTSVPQAAPAVSETESEAASAAPPATSTKPPSAVRPSS